MIIEITIDGKVIKVNDGVTVLDAARQAGIDIPTLCYCEKIEPCVSCFVCVVKIKGQEKFIPACATKVQNGMIVINNSEEVRDCRRKALALLLSEHVALPNGLKCKCASKTKCRLKACAEEYGADHTRYTIGQRREETRKIYDSGLVHEPGKCITCGKCVTITKENGIKPGLSFKGRGSNVCISAPFEIPFDKAMGEALQLCVDSCPTGALWITPKYKNDKSESAHE
ncbi:MAG: 2Fe-2S iron-sulfur cluster-binding protein [Chitinispirillia bacterium]|nr:2Fe-2S iron-sulfur cluster-binding protein [Chitinispirillia bacterium]